jgi:hypothetical protein
MNLILWIILGISHLFTVLWYVLIQKDIFGYTNTQMKILGYENKKQIETPALNFLLKFYAVALLVLTLGFTLYLFSI